MGRNKAEELKKSLSHTTRLIRKIETLLSEIAEQAAEIDRLRAVWVAAAALVQVQQNKGEPADHPDNRRLYELGDVILVNESNLCDLESAIRNIPAPAKAGEDD
jgi:hypothetical protein